MINISKIVELCKIQDISLKDENNNYISFLEFFRLLIEKLFDN